MHAAGVLSRNGFDLALSKRELTGFGFAAAGRRTDIAASTLTDAFSRVGLAVLRAALARSTPVLMTDPQKALAA